uniref:(northern house mosquito) hypothetical protein n=1 Tax=Culex pipiens TaxID=7175 RepID=A0A8D8NLQ5_CULPI
MVEPMKFCCWAWDATAEVVVSSSRLGLLVSMVDMCWRRRMYSIFDSSGSVVHPGRLPASNRISLPPATRNAAPCCSTSLQARSSFDQPPRELRDLPPSAGRPSTVKHA